GVVGVGTSRMNNYQVARATQAFSNDLIRKAGGRVGNGIAVAFDTRETSESFSDTVVRVLLGNGIGVARFLGPRSVPQLSFAIRHLGLEGGIMITASHNPKEYNGFKVYNKYGAQMVPEDMKTIAREFRNIKEFSQIHPYVGYLRLNSIHQKIGLSNDYKFRNAIVKASVCDDVDYDTPIVYSALHGTGIGCVDELLKERGFKKVSFVKEQMKADGSFSTVDVPNPEDPKSFEMAIALAKEKDAEIVLLTDPDCDRVGVALKDKEGGYKILTGNQAGALLLDFIIRNKKDMPENPLMVQTIVTGTLGKEIAEKAGITVKETLTGFKYIGEIMNQCDESGEYNFVFGYEESGGCLSGTHARDKDGANACMLFAEMAGCCRKNGTTILDRLEELYAEYGCSKEYTSSVMFEGLEGMEKMDAVMDNVRKAEVALLAGEAVSVVDYLNDETGLPKENALKISFADGSFAALRPSGTEPKLKVYYFVKGESFGAADARKAKIQEELKGIAGL
ncbi:MAG: phospho-sugar mutase, partial [Firmicutes bacterium]|nr:phospho-sugar mutase [Bacillota bacterium]